MREARNGLVPALAAAALALAACRTTHELGRFGDPAARDALQDAAAGQPLHVVEPLEVTPGRPQRRYPVAALGPEGVRWVRSPGDTALTPAAEVRSLSTFARGRGARDGALLAGIPSFILTTVVAGLLVVGEDACTDGCNPRRAGTIGLGAGALAGLGMAAVGAYVGWTVGHEDRYLFAPPAR